MSKTDVQPVMAMHQVSKIYQSRKKLFGPPAGQVVALNDVSLEFMPGEVFGLVGESGSGKTTCGRLLTALEKPTSGSIFLHGQEITGQAKLPHDFRRQVQMVFQDPYQSLNPQISILDSVSEPLICNKIGSADERQDRSILALEQAGLTPPEDYLMRFPHQLSGGQRQRVAIARAIITEPNCLVADEPTSMLDASYSAQIFDILLGVRDKLGSTVVFITHALAAARYLCDRIAVIYHGKLMETGPAIQVIENPAHPYTQALLNATPKFGRKLGPPAYDTLLAKPRQTDAAGGCGFFPRCKLGDPQLCAQEVPAWHQVDTGQLCACHLAQGPKII